MQTLPHTAASGAGFSIQGALLATSSSVLDAPMNSKVERQGLYAFMGVSYTKYLWYVSP